MEEVGREEFTGQRQGSVPLLTGANGVSAKASGAPLLKTSYVLSAKIESIFMGGRVVEGSVGDALFTACGNDIVWTNRSTGQVVQRFVSDDAVAYFVISPNQKYLISSHITSLLVKIWDISSSVDGDELPLDTRRPPVHAALHSWKAHEAPVLCMKIHASGALLATGSADSSIKVWDISGRQSTPSLLTHHFKGHGGIISSLAFHPQSLILASGSEDCKIRIWSLESYLCSAVLDGHSSLVTCLAFTRPTTATEEALPSPWLLASGSRDQIVNVWDVSQVAPDPIPSRAHGAKGGKKGQQLACRSDLSPLHSLFVKEGIEVISWLPLLPDIPGSESMLYTGGAQGLKLWKLTGEGELDLVAKSNLATSSRELANMITQAQFVPSRNEILVALADHTLAYLSLPTLKRTPYQLSGYNQEILSMAYLAQPSAPTQASHLAVASNSPDMKVYDVREGGAFRCIITPGHQDTILCCASTPAKALLASPTSPVHLVTGSKDNTIRLWQWMPTERGCGMTLHCIGVGQGHTGPVSAVAIGSKYIISASHDRTIKMWDIPAALTSDAEQPLKLQTKLTFQAHEKDIQSVSIAPNEKLFASGSLDRVAKVWSALDGRLLGECKGHRRGIWSVAFSPVAQVLATTSTDKTIKLWSITDYSCIRTLEGHLNTVLGVQFLSSGAQLLSTGSDGLCKLWNVKTSECIATLDQHEDRVWCLTLSADDGLLATGSADSTICLCKDMTEVLELESQKEKELLLSRQQDLSLYVAKKDYKNAILLALELDQPMKLLKLFQQTLLLAEKGAVMGSVEVDTVLGELSDDQTVALLSHLRNWNTQARHAVVAQAILNVLLKAKGVKGLLSLPQSFGGAGKAWVDPLLAYTQRHFDHASELLRASYLLDYALFSMAE